MPEWKGAFIPYFEQPAFNRDVCEKYGNYIKRTC
jgi:hypothetical protein